MPRVPKNRINTRRWDSTNSDESSPTFARMKLSLSLTFIAVGLAAARSDWSKPCFHGECNYELEHPSGGFATLHFSGAPHMMADITPAAGWVVLDCDANALEQDIRLVCANDETESENCAHLFAQGGPVNKVLRLPESCGRGPFVRIADAKLDSDQSIPIHAAHKIRRRDGVTPDVHVLSVDTAWDKLDSAGAGDLEFSIVGSTIRGAYIDSNDNLEERGAFSDWVGKIISKLKAAAGNVVDGVVNATTIESGNKTEIKTNYDNESTIVDLSAECAGKKLSLTVKTYLKLDLTGHVGFAAKGSVKDGVKEFGSLVGWHGDINGGVKVSAQVAGPMDHEQTLIRYGVPPFDWPGVISIGPRFEVRAHINGALDITGTADIGINYNIKKRTLVLIFVKLFEYVWPGMKGENDGQEGDIQPGTPKVNLSASGLVDAKLNVTVGIIPAVVIGLEGFAGKVKAAVAVETEGYIRIYGTGKAEAGITKSVDHPKSPRPGSSSGKASRPSSPKSPSSPRKHSRDLATVTPKAGAQGSFAIYGGVELRGVAMGKLPILIPGAGAKTSRKWWGKEWTYLDTGVGSVGSLKKGKREIDASAPKSLSRQGSTASIKSTSSTKSTTSTKSSGSGKKPAEDVSVSNATDKVENTWKKGNWKCPPAVEKMYEMVFVGKADKAPRWEFGHIYKENVGVA
ncbi:hypothetical protein PLEOSDRAFT_169388 [Pleurotus ostreatus PC15]|uniref:Uncharacterized protein n=1 Tax=Pleurotus ostreatus (strain PC15) TaxID=1137138 RepID=A0A067NBZ0_PLEO1|nr:hypothetical protein PLEOSDRAFT_169388 [Pleurotus ostreatus PC15]